ncbi:MAG: DUF6985 domain-containing protein [Minisyncoccota bacterium]
MSGIIWKEPFWECTKFIPFLGKEMEVVFITAGKGEKPADEQLQLLDRLDSISNEFVTNIDDAAETYKKEVYENIDPAEADLSINREDISRHFSLDTVVIPEIGQSKDVLFFLTGECDWEKEHGIEILVKDGQVVSCGMQNALYLNEEWKSYIS